MHDMEKVIIGLQCCRDSMNDNPYGRCGECPYNEVSLSVQECRSVLCADALAILTTCTHCSWYLTGVCTNRASDRRADFTRPTDTCDHWEARGG